MKVSGGFLDGAEFNFKKGLNCIIGGRGTGKTTTLELIRYALDDFPRQERSPAARRKLENLMQQNLGGGRVELQIVTEDGVIYEIHRSVGEEPIILDEKGTPTALTISGLTSRLFKAAIYSQNEVESIADQKSFQLDLLDSFAAEEIAAAQEKIAGIIRQVKTLAAEMEPLRQQLAGYEDDIKHLPSVEEKLKTFGTGDGKIADEVSRVHLEKALRDRESKAVEQSSEALDQMKEALGSVCSNFRTHLRGCFSEDLLNGPNGNNLSKIYEKLRECDSAVATKLDEAMEIVEGCGAEVVSAAAKLMLAHKSQELAFRTTVEKHSQHQKEAAERANLERKRNEILVLKQKVAEISHSLQQQEGARISLLEKLSEARDERFAIRRKVAKRLNDSLSHSIAVSISQGGCLDNYQELIETRLKGQKVKQGLISSKLIRTLPPQQTAQLVREGDVSRLMELGELNSDQAQAVLYVFRDPAALCELETVEIDDAPSIRLRVGETERESTSLSTGQKCTTILPILLLEGDAPLLIDQPEDNLDNRFIFKTVVDSVQRIQKNRQLIFVTHNPNIPVLGNAARIFVMESDGEQGTLTAHGSVDQCRESIVTLLEGGEDAFKKREKCYFQDAEDF